MSWVQWRDEIWPATGHEAELQFHLWPADSGCPRQGWSWNLFHHIRPSHPTPEHEVERYIHIELMNLNFDQPDWRRFAGLEIRATPVWHDTHESTNEYGHLDVAAATVHAITLDRTGAGEARQVKSHKDNAIAHDFILRFGSRDGFSFSCELDAWMIPQDEYYRQEPEAAAELARFAEGPPNLRVMARTRFTRGSVLVPRSDDPIPRARRYLREAIGYEEELGKPKVEWDLRHTPDHKETVSMVGWRSRVEFHTPA